MARRAVVRSAMALVGAIFLGACQSSKQPPLVVDSGTTGVTATVPSSVTAASQASAKTSVASLPSAEATTAVASTAQTETSMPTVTVGDSSGPAPSVITPGSTLSVSSTPDPAVESAIRADVENFNRMYEAAILALPNVDTATISAIEALSVRDSDSAKATRRDFSNLIKEGIRIRKNSPEINVFKVTSVKMIDAKRALVATCASNNLVTYTDGPNAATSDDVVTNDALGTEIREDEWLLVGDHWKNDVQRNVERYEGNRCDSFK
jgi:hypothetical protein